MRGGIEPGGFVICMPPRGCGWYWAVRVVVIRPWFGRPIRVLEYRGAYWEDPLGRPEYSSRPDLRAPGAWMGAADWQAAYGDCMPHIAPVQELEAIAISRDRRRP